ncbi:MAG: divergent polysaccharide deacetylase family protein, partial [Alphaproteobacteria bacterium]
PKPSPPAPAEAAKPAPAPPHAAEAERPAAPPPAKEAAKEPSKELAEGPAKEAPTGAPKETAKEPAKETAKESPSPVEKRAPPAPAKEQAAESAKPAPESQIAALPAPVPQPPEAKPPEAKPPAGPDPALLERGREGMLPTIAPDGRQPWRYYARPFDDKDKRPRIAVVVSDLGLSSAATETAIQQLPGSVTLAFSPYAKNLEEWTRLARVAGHEVFLNLPMEPVDYPEQDPGPYALLTSIDPKQNLFRMDWLLSRAAGYAGVTNHMGSRFTVSGADLRPVLDVLKSRGLMFLDSRSSDQSIAAKMAKDLGMPMAYNNRFIDAEASRDAIDKNLSEIERIARRTGYAVAMGSAYPVTIERISNWLPTAEAKGFVIAPVTALADKQEVK